MAVVLLGPWQRMRHLPFVISIAAAAAATRGFSRTKLRVAGHRSDGCSVSTPVLRDLLMTMTSDSVKLSKNLMRMKFMQRGLDAETKKQLEEDEKRIISDEHWCLDLPELKAKENLIIEEQSFVPCEELTYGRMSFRGFNPEVEKLMTLLNPQAEEEKQDEETSTMQTDVSDEAMALRYESLVGSLKRKFVKKRDRVSLEEDVNHSVVKTTNAKRVFLKPTD